MDKTTVHTQFINGIPVTIPNTTKEGDGFYVSYNNYDTGVYGSDTTALVIGNCEHFYILNGDHRQEYFKLMEYGLSACLKYFDDNTDKINKYSERM